MPERTWRPEGYAAARAAEARQALNHQQDAKTLWKRSTLSAERGRRAVLVCGWRPVWTAESHRLRDRVHQLVSDSLTGSRIVFANGLPDEKFCRLMTETCGFTKVEPDGYALLGVEREIVGDSVYTSDSGVLIEHVRGDVAEIELLRKIVYNVPVQVAIVLGTYAHELGDPLSPKMY